MVLKKLSLVYYAVNQLISWRLHEGSARNICWDFFSSAIRSNWSPSSKRAVSEGAPKPNLAKIQVKLVLLKNKLTFWSHKVDLGNWEYLQNKSAWNNFFKFFFVRLFAIYEFSRVLSPKKTLQKIIGSWFAMKTSQHFSVQLVLSQI